METKERPVRGRPKSTVNWPDGQFTFKELSSSNAACDSLLRRRVREAVKNGLVSKVTTIQTARTGRPETVYKPAPTRVETEPEQTEPEQREQWTQNQQESVGTSMP